MTNVIADSANDTRLPSLRQYIADVQHRMCRLSGVLETIAYLESEGSCQEGQCALIFLAADMGAEINNALDSVNLPEA